MMRTLLLIMATIFPAASASGEEMTFDLVGTGGNCAGCEWIRAEGRITPETPQRFREYADTYPGIVVGLHSSGGDLSAGLELGRIFRELGITTAVFRSPPSAEFPSTYDIVPEGARCESACAYAFLGGMQRSIDHDAFLGFHQFSDPTAVGEDESSISELEFLVEAARDQYVTGLIADYLIEMDIDLRLYPIVAAVEPGDDMRYLTTEEIVELNVDNSHDELGEWEVLPFGNGLFAEARTSRSNRVVRLFCDATGAHYLNVGVGNRLPSEAEQLRDTYREYSNDQIGLVVDGQSIVARVAEVAQLAPSGDVVISLALDPFQARLIARARQITYDYDHYFPPSAVRGQFWQPFFFNEITGTPDFPLNTFRLCV